VTKTKLPQIYKYIITLGLNYGSVNWTIKCRKEN